MILGLLRTVAIAAACSAMLSVTPSSAQSDGAEELFAERLHADLPLYTFEWEDFWPRNFYDEDAFGCASRVGFGDWEFRPDPANEFGDPYWYRFDNYGVFHCAANRRIADERNQLEEGEFTRGFFARIGEARVGSQRWELWVFQDGMVPGSDYLLLARQPEDGLVEKFTVLQRKCPRGKERAVDGLDIWLTRYCAIESRAELLALARKMLRLPPLGVIERVDDISENPDDAEDMPVATDILQD